MEVFQEILECAWLTDDICTLLPFIGKGFKRLSLAVKGFGGPGTEHNKHGAHQSPQMPNHSRGRRCPQQPFPDRVHRNSS